MQTMRQHTPVIATFCGARPGRDPAYAALAEDFGAALGRRGCGLVYGAGGVGVMGAVAGAALAHGAAVTGVVPHDLHERERSQKAPGQIFVVQSMHERKALMYRLSSAFAVLPGGFGTLDEFMEVATWNQLGMHRKRLVLLNTKGYFDSLLDFLDTVMREGFMTVEDRNLVCATDDVEEALDLLMSEPLEAVTAVTLPSPQARVPHEVIRPVPELRVPAS
ncbi:TIGR00730 family Rossman fold protein [Streptomyces cyaneofuscatus]|uniref:LOG family protein n=2 Tax=Streptomyces TaxID=1883 RepID=UPI0013DA1D4F|nr:TIGR00730 family Rossman fold protein [Streptomyces cyaneofuscatus]NDZ69109.1 TIGR00730 family Rossman fold protein [Streptomyces cyaneofuscatus]CAD5967903.1 Cytokinin riboside 5'-monophosphate phosphoribohydrolase [Streptomyces sp. KY70]CAD5976060.1 Cytokinin riboside 5'-monophosphate phosphoribohydrolase [Streptomyces sp. KY75]